MKGFSDWNLRTQHHTSLSSEDKQPFRLLSVRSTAYASPRLPLSKNPKRISLHHRTCKNKTSAPLSPALFHCINKTAGHMCFHSPGRMSSGCFTYHRDSVRHSAAPTKHPNKRIDSVSFIKDPYSEVPHAKIAHSQRSIHAQTQWHTIKMTLHSAQFLQDAQDRQHLTHNLFSYKAVSTFILSKTVTITV